MNGGVTDGNGHTINDENLIIPDEEVAPPSYSASHDGQGLRAAGPTTTNNSWFSPLSSNPKVDLSQMFTPFTSSNNFKANNTVKERQYTGGDTLDEPVWQTFKKDLTKIGRRVLAVIWPASLSSIAARQQAKLLDMARNTGINVPDIPSSMNFSSSQSHLEQSDPDALLKESLEWDLWGPLIFSLMYSVSLGFTASKDQTNSVFSGTFALIWLFFIIIGLNIQLLGGTISFMSAMSATGYSMFPIMLGSVLFSFLIKNKGLRLVIGIVLLTWSIFSGNMSLKSSGVLPNRTFLAMYPISLMYLVLFWISLIN